MSSPYCINKKWWYIIITELKQENILGEFSITYRGKTLCKSKYTIDIEKKTFHTKESNLVFDFFDLKGWTFCTGGYCTFNTGSSCIFMTKWYCTFNTGACCTFTTKWNCTFNTGHKCTFNTDYECTFNTGSSCTFKTGNGCTLLLFNVNGCTFQSYDNGCIILDRQNYKHYLLTKGLIDVLKISNG